MDAIYGVREDGSVWISLGNPKTGPHCQFDLMGEFEAKLICNAFARVKTLEDALEFYADPKTNCPGAIARKVLAAKELDV